MPVKCIRKANPRDVPVIYKYIDNASRTARVIARTHYELYANVRDFFVFDEGNGVQGCCALHVTWHDLAEVKSLVVDPSLRGRGIGKYLVEAALDEARELKLQRVFALTNVEGFFQKLGFQIVDKHELPQKIWGECVRCPNFPDCDEIAVVYHTGIPADSSISLPTLV